MERTNFTINAADYSGQPITISCDGVDDNKLAHFGGLDLAVKAARQLISSTQGPMSFPEKNGDYDIRSKVVALLLNEVGELIRNTSMEPEFLDGVSNIELVKDFIIESLPKNREINKLLEEDDLLIKQYKESVEEEENEIWNSIMNDITKK
ncbi:hypothetical protein M5X11_15905 [Paenibacillus alginolyticus]|uniref:hypothetical protein n=1 Tax=Paenibacillus alginolyticus TaxID=59839 RepID=UPI000421037C|nr:hypothetical protein [Paenibacillus alginolyticus]MCY9666428.1 hypothetical protein [Paenibacillus alginolyticus]